MSADKNGSATRSDVLLDQAVAMLAPLARLLVANGVTLPQFVAALKPEFLRAAYAELSESGARINGSAISLVSGVHRKDVRALGSGSTPPSQARERLPTLVDEVIVRWTTDPHYIDLQGSPRTLPVRTANGTGGPSFEQLSRSVSSDFHGRAVLEELHRRGVVHINDAGVTLTLDGTIADQRYMQTMAYIGESVYDHLAAIEANFTAAQTGERPPHLEQSIAASGLSSESVHVVQELVGRVAESAMRRIGSQSEQCVEHDKHRGGDQAMRMRFGIYFYSERESPFSDNSPLLPKQ